MSGEKKQRKLSSAERLRLEEFGKLCDELAAQGYKRVDLTVSMFKANVLAVVALIVISAVVFPLFFLVHPDAEFVLSPVEIVMGVIVFLVLVVAHELVHGFTWSRFTPHGFADVDFGVMLDSLSPYCTCKMPLPRDHYIIGALMPLIVFGLVPMVIAFCAGWVPLLDIAILMTVAAAGDVMIVVKALGYHTNAREVLLYDHPTDAGCVIFER
ncbi:MAG: DUF3267 domain-containing protein [Coriobacteriia bacterium]|nr:DUF3267 domain-containing protein [Coriobacteriia bacterium]